MSPYTRRLTFTQARQSPARLRLSAGLTQTLELPTPQMFRPGLFAVDPQRVVSYRRSMVQPRSLRLATLFRGAPKFMEQQVVGFDLGSESVRHKAIDEALRTGLPASTEPVRLQEAGRPKGLLLLRPVFTDAARSKPLGLAFAVLRLEAALNLVVPDDLLEIRMLLLRSDAPRNPLHHHGRRASSQVSGCPLKGRSSPSGRPSSWHPIPDRLFCKHNRRAGARWRCCSASCSPLRRPPLFLR